MRAVGDWIEAESEAVTVTVSVSVTVTVAAAVPNLRPQRRGAPGASFPQ